MFKRVLALMIATNLTGNLVNGGIVGTIGNTAIDYTFYGLGKVMKPKCKRFNIGEYENFIEGANFAFSQRALNFKYFKWSDFVMEYLRKFDFELPTEPVSYDIYRIHTTDYTASVTPTGLVSIENLKHLRILELSYDEKTKQLILTADVDEGKEIVVKGEVIVKGKKKPNYDAIEQAKKNRLHATMPLLLTLQKYVGYDTVAQVTTPEEEHLGKFNLKFKITIPKAKIAVRMKAPMWKCPGSGYTTFLSFAYCNLHMTKVLYNHYYTEKHVFRILSRMEYIKFDSVTLSDYSDFEVKSAVPTDVKFKTSNWFIEHRDFVVQTLLDYGLKNYQKEGTDEHGFLTELLTNSMKDAAQIYFDSLDDITNVPIECDPHQSSPYENSVEFDEEGTVFQGYEDETLYQTPSMSRSVSGRTDDTIAQTFSESTSVVDEGPTDTISHTVAEPRSRGGEGRTHSTSDEDDYTQSSTLKSIGLYLSILLSSVLLKIFQFFGGR